MSQAVEMMSKQIMIALMPAALNIVIAFSITLSYSWMVSLFFRA